MSGQPMNTRPYGDSWASNNAPAVSGGSLEEQALNRAIQKLEIVRSAYSGDREVGLDVMQFVPGTILALLLGLPCLLGAVAILADNGPVGGAGVLLLLSAAFFSIPVVVYFRTRPTTTKGALTGFYRALAGKRYKRARLLTVQTDLDTFPRYQPSIPNLGTPSGHPRSFADEYAFSEYWRELLLSHTAPYCYATIRNVRETDVAPDLKLVDFELKLIMNTRLWLLLIFIALLLAVIVDMATRKTVTVQMRKLLVRVGDEWHLFSAEWQGYEEFNTQWLSNNRGVGSPTPPSGHQPTGQQPPMHQPPMHQPPAPPPPRQEVAPWDQPPTNEGGTQSHIEKAPWD